MTWKSKRGIWNWRACLTKEEAAFIAASDKAAVKIEKVLAEYRKKFQGERSIIVNRAIQRAKFNARPRSPQESASE